MDGQTGRLVLEVLALERRLLQQRQQGVARLGQQRRFLLI